MELRPETGAWIIVCNAANGWEPDRRITWVAHLDAPEAVIRRQFSNDRNWAASRLAALGRRSLICGHSGRGHRGDLTLSRPSGAKFSSGKPTLAGTRVRDLSIGPYFLDKISLRNPPGRTSKNLAQDGR